MHIAEIVKHFKFEGGYAGADQLASGHINDTYVVVFVGAGGQKRRYILQRINRNVFKDPGLLMDNIVRVTRHLQKRIVENGGDPARETMNVIPTRGGNSYHRTGTGDCWRAYDFVEGARSYQKVEDPLQFYHAGRAVGRFQMLLDDFPAGTLHETIPGFHDTPGRLNVLFQAVEKNSAGRADLVVAEIDFVKKRAADTKVLVDLLAEGKLPLRVIHNDTKFNNVLIDDETGEGICLVDLDTVMPGLSLYDFGDAIRYGSSTAAEDEPDLSRVKMDMMLYEQFCRGYLQETAHFLTPLEIEYLPFSARLITLECGIRFLTDYIEGDLYFKTQRKDQNLDRARTQFKLVSDMENNMKRMQAIVEKYSDAG